MGVWGGGGATANQVTGGGCFPGLACFGGDVGGCRLNVARRGLAIPLHLDRGYGEEKHVDLIRACVALHGRTRRGELGMRSSGQ